MSKSPTSSLSPPDSDHLDRRHLRVHRRVRRHRPHAVLRVFRSGFAHDLRHPHSRGVTMMVTMMVALIAERVLGLDRDHVAGLRFEVQLRPGTHFYLAMWPLMVNEAASAPLQACKPSASLLGGGSVAVTGLSTLSVATSESASSAAIVFSATLSCCFFVLHTHSVFVLVIKGGRPVPGVLVHDHWIRCHPSRSFPSPSPSVYIAVARRNIRLGSKSAIAGL